MAVQINHALSMMQRRNVTMRVVPYDAGAHPVMPG
jgi:hypothetical protein